MPSPFPGMDPYLEAHWRDVHASLIIYARDALQAVLPNSLRARVEERVVLETPEGVGESSLFPDVRIVEYGARRSALCQPSDVAVMEPLIVEAEYEPITEGFLEIVDRASGNRVVTVIEFLSPSNKSPGSNRNQYRRKQYDLCHSDASLVEIDLNREGSHTLAVPLDHIPESRRTQYMACVRRAWRREKAEVYSMPLWQRLPPIRIPLRQTDDDVLLDLQKLIEQCYANGAYEGTLNYNSDPIPALTKSDAAWASAMLIEKGYRPSTKQPRRKRKPKPPPS